MLGAHKDVKDRVKAGRAKATGSKSPLKTAGVSKKKVVLTKEAVKPSLPPAAAVEEDIEDTHESEARIKRVEDETKVKAKMDAFINKKVDAERNRRLRSGEGPLNKKSLAMLKSSLRIDAERKFLKIAGNSSPMESHSQASSESAERDPDRDISDVDSQSESSTASYVTGCEASHMGGAPIKFDLGNRNSSAASSRTSSASRSPGIASSTPAKRSTSSRPNSSQSPRTPQSRTSSTTRNTTSQQSRNGCVGPTRTTKRKTLGTKSTGTNSTTTTPLTKYSYMSEDETSVETSISSAAATNGTEDDQWWAAEEAKWKEELEARRQEDGYDPQEDEGREPNEADIIMEPLEQPEFPDEELENDICLKTQIVTKLPTDQGLGVQLYTPKNEHGVRITKIVADGPFGRTNSFDDGDVIVEINGIPLLYAGHESVFDTIKTEMMANNQMSVTVCSPEELLKLEALVKNENQEEFQSDSPTPLWKSWTSRLLEKSPNKEAVKSWLKPMLKVFDSSSKLKKPNTHDKRPESPDVPQGPVVGSLKGAPAWWKDKRKKSQTQQQQHDDADSDNIKTTAADDTCTSFGVKERESAYLIYRADIRDLEAYKAEYMSETTRIITKYGGRWLARGGKITHLEGQPLDDEKTVLQRMVLIEFPNIDAATDFFQSEEYQAARTLRLSIATAEITVLEGMPRV